MAGLGMIRPISFATAQHIIATTVLAPGKDEDKQDPNTIGKIQLSNWINTHPAALALQEFLSMGPRVKGALRCFKALLAHAESALPSWTLVVEMSRRRKQMTIIQSQSPVTDLIDLVWGPTLLHHTSTSATIVLLSRTTCEIECLVYPALFKQLLNTPSMALPFQEFRQVMDFRILHCVLCSAFTLG